MNATAHDLWTPERANKALPLVRRIADDLVMAYRRWQELVERYPFLTESKDGEWEAVFDTRPLQMKGVHEAARLAEAIMQAALRGSEVKSLASPSELASWTVLQQARQAATLQKQLRAARHDSNRRAAERNRAKSQLASAREKQDHLRKKLA